jgi:[acyl-carrier-protein] S-malonyltransferase
MGIAVIFPGQGVQGADLGRPWLDHPAWHIVDEAEQVLGEPVGRLLLGATDDELRSTRAAQLAVLLTSLVAWEAARDRIGEPVAFAGHSLGQVTALIASGCLSLEDGLRLAVDRATSTQAAADAHPGKLAAVIGAETDLVERAAGGADCWLANDNAPGQVVIGGTPAGVDAGAERAIEAGARKVLALNVGGAFHTPLMQDAVDALRPTLDAASYRRPSAPIVSNGDARAYTDGDGWRTRLADHLVNPVQWKESMLTLAELGIDALAEVGPGSTLTAMAKRTVPDVARINLDSPSAIETLVVTS